MKKLLAILLALVLVFSLAACGSSTNKPADDQNVSNKTNEVTDDKTNEQEGDVFEGDVPLKENVKVKMAGLLNSNLSIWYVALEKGYFLERGIELEFLTVASGNEASTALASGDVDLAFASCNNLQSAIASGNDDIVSFAVTTGDGGTEYYCTNLAMIVHPDSGIKDDTQLKGAVIGTQLGGTSELYARLYLIDKGYDPDKDVDWVNVNPVDQVTAFINGDIDICSTSEPYATVMQEEVPGSWEVVRGGDYYTYASVCTTTRKFFEQNPDIMLKLTAALSEGAFYTRNNPEESGEILSHWISGYDKDILGKSIKNLRFDPRWTEHSEFVWNNALDSLISTGKLTERVPIENYVDNTHMKKVVEAHPEWFSDMNDAKLLPYACATK